MWNASGTVVGNFINEVSLYALSNIICSPISTQTRNLNKYAMRIKSMPDGLIRKKYQSVFFAVGSGGQSFQHFVQDLAPIIAYYKVFLDQNPQISLAIRRPIASFRMFDSIMERMEINNQIIFVDEEDSFQCETLYVPIFSPLNALYSTPIELYQSLSQIIQKRNSSNIIQSFVLLYIRRFEQTRNISNSNQLLKALSSWSSRNGFILKTVDTKSESPAQIISKFEEAKFIIGIHGGANYNILFSKPDATFVELIPNKNTNTLADFCLALGVNYSPIILDGSLSDENFYVNTVDVTDALDFLIEAT